MLSSYSESLTDFLTFHIFKDNHNYITNKPLFILIPIIRWPSSFYTAFFKARMWQETKSYSLFLHQKLLLNNIWYKKKKEGGKARAKEVPLLKFGEQHKISSIFSGLVFVNILHLIHTYNT